MVRFTGRKEYNELTLSTFLSEKNSFFKKIENGSSAYLLP